MCVNLDMNQLWKVLHRNKLSFCNSFEILGHTAHYNYREMNTICMNWTAVAPPGQHLALRAPFSLARRAQGSAPGPPLPRHPTSVKRVNRVEERKLLPESENLWGGPQALRAHHNRDNSRLYPWAPGRNSHSLSLTMCGNTRGGRGGGISIDRSPSN